MWAVGSIPPPAPSSQSISWAGGVDRRFQLSYLHCFSSRLVNAQSQQFTFAETKNVRDCKAMRTTTDTEILSMGTLRPSLGAHHTAHLSRIHRAEGAHPALRETLARAERWRAVSGPKGEKGKKEKLIGGTSDIEIVHVCLGMSCNSM